MAAYRKSAWQHTKDRARRAAADFSILEDSVIAVLSALIGFAVLKKESAIENAIIAIACGLGGGCIWQLLKVLWAFLWKVPRDLEEERDLAVIGKIETETAANAARNLNAEWKELAARFEKAPNYVRADWQCIRKDNATISETWRFAGDVNTQMETLCRYAGSLLTKSSNTAHLSDDSKAQSNAAWRWLFCLKDDRNAIDRTEYGIGGDGSIILFGSISNVAGKSAIVCLDRAAIEL